MKGCSKCHRSEPIVRFAFNPKAKDRRNSWCTECTGVSGAAWARTPNGRRAKGYSQIKNKYGVSAERFDEMVIAHAGRCGACGDQLINKVGIDHDHETGHVRGLLCVNCNWALGHVDDSVKRLRGLISYLQRYGTK
jgi:hypothetical protein